MPLTCAAVDFSPSSSTCFVVLPSQKVFFFPPLLSLSPRRAGDCYQQISYLFEELTQPEFSRIACAQQATVIGRVINYSSYTFTVHSIMLFTSLKCCTLEQNNINLYSNNAVPFRDESTLLTCLLF